LKAFVRYQLISYIRSLKLIPPAFIFLAWIFILYAYKNVPILSSYGVSSIALYLVMTWITMSIFTMEEESEKHILFAHLAGKLKFLIGKWVALLITMSPLALFAILYPLVTGSFQGEMTVGQYGMTFYSHIIFGLFGILVGTLFSATTLAMKKYAWLSAVFIIVVSLAAKSLIESLSFFKWILWVVPPVFGVIEYMEDSMLVNYSFMTDSLFVLIYLLGLTVLTIFLFKKKER